MNEGDGMRTKISGFYKISPEERLEIIAKQLSLSNEEKEIILGQDGFSVDVADRMVENVIGSFPIPLGIAVNFKVNEKEVFVPMATEEPSVIAAASNAAKQSAKRSEEHTSELQSRGHLVCRLLLEKKKNQLPFS